MASKQPVTPLSAHRLFPTVVAIWFAALFGLGCAVLPASLIEAVVTATGLPAILPAAAPPLGFTAQASLAIAAAVSGALCGFVLARKVAAAQGAVRPAHAEAPRAPGRREKPGARRPLSIKEELDDEPLFASSFAADEPLAGRRRSLMPAADAFPPEPEAPFAQLPEYEARPADEPVPFDEIEPEDAWAPEPQPPVAPVAEEPVFEDVPDVEPDAPAPPPAPPTQAHSTQAQVGILPSDPRADPGQMGIVQLTERLGHALQGRLDRGQLRPSAPPPALLAELAGLPPRPAMPERQPTAPATLVPEPVASPAPLPEESAAPESLPAPESSVAESAPMPFAGRDFALEEIDPQEALFGAADFESLPPRSATFAPSMTEALRSAALQLDEFGEDEEEEEDDSGIAEEQYGSLLAIKGLTGEYRDPFEEAEEDTGYEEAEDSRPFDAQAPAPWLDEDQGETQAEAQAEDETEALRRALAQLQRMSGAA